MQTCFAVLGIEPGTSCKLDKHSLIELGAIYAGLELTTILPQPPECKDGRCMPPYSASW